MRPRCGPGDGADPRRGALKSRSAGPITVAHRMPAGDPLPPEAATRLVVLLDPDAIFAAAEAGAVAQRPTMPAAALTRVVVVDGVHRLDDLPAAIAREAG